MKPIDTTEAEALIAKYAAGVSISKDDDTIIAKIAAVVVANNRTINFIDALKLAMRAAYCLGVSSTKNEAEK